MYRKSYRLSRRSWYNSACLQGTIYVIYNMKPLGRVTPVSAAFFTGIELCGKGSGHEKKGGSEAQDEMIIAKWFAVAYN